MEEHYGLKEQVTDLHTQCNILREQLKVKDDAFEKLRDRLKEKVGLNLPIYDYKCIIIHMYMYTCVHVCVSVIHQLTHLYPYLHVHVYTSMNYMYMYT